jgi:hypothetical protein
MGPRRLHKAESERQHYHPNQQPYIPPWAYGGDELVEPLQLPSGSHPRVPQALQREGRGAGSEGTKDRSPAHTDVRVLMSSLVPEYFWFQQRASSSHPRALKPKATSGASGRPKG